MRIENRKLIKAGDGLDFCEYNCRKDLHLGFLLFDLGFIIIKPVIITKELYT